MKNKYSDGFENEIKMKLIRGSKVGIYKYQL